MGNKILDYTSVGEKKGKFDVLANNIKESLNNISSGLGELEKGTISESQVNDFQDQIKTRVQELDDISEKFKDYLNYIIESNKDEDSKQANEVAEEVGLMKTSSEGSGGGSNGGGGGGRSGGGSSGGGGYTPSAPAAPQPEQQAPQPGQQAPTTPPGQENVSKTDYDAYKKETSDRFQKTIDDQKITDQRQNRVINNLSKDFDSYKTDNNKINTEQDKKIQEVFDKLKGHDSRITNLDNRTTTLETTKTNTVTQVPVPSYTPAPATTEPTPPTQTNTTPTPPTTPETPKPEEPKKEPEVKEEPPIDNKPMEIDPSKFDEDLSKELNSVDPSTSTVNETEPTKDDNGIVKAAAFGALGLGALGLGGGALYYHNKKKQEEELNNEENLNDNDYLYDDDEF